MSPTERSLAYLRERGWTVCVVERWNAFAKVRQDALGFGDLLGCRLSECVPDPLREIALIQVTTVSNMAARRKKILNLNTYHAWKNSGGLVLLHGWHGWRKHPSARKTWRLKEEWL